MQKTAAFDEGDEVAITVIENGCKSKKTVRVAKVQYSERANNYKYQLKETKDSQTMYKGGRLFAEDELADP
jgi:hypothetical protein